MASILLVKSELLSAYEDDVTAPLGILSLAAAARLEGHTVGVMDLRVTPTRLIPALLNGRLGKGWDVVGLSCLSSGIAVMGKVVRYVRRRAPGSLIVAGGPGPSSDTEACLEGGVDACVIGEGELTLCEIMRRLDAGHDWRDVPGIAFMDPDGTVRRTAPRTPVPDLDELPIPAWDLHDFEHYSRFLSMGLIPGKRAEIMTSRGCPYRCIFCHTLFGKKFRARSPRNVLREMTLLRDKYGIRRFDILDDIFNLDGDRAKQILAGVRDRLPDCELRFPNGLRGDTLDGETIHLLRQAHTSLVIIAIETASERLQKLLKKNIDIKKASNSIRLLKEQGITTAAFFMIGLPTETREEMEATFALIERLPIDWPFISIAIPYRNTGLWAYGAGTAMENADVARLDPRLGWEEGNLSDLPSTHLRRRIDRIFLKHLIKSGNLTRVIAHKSAWWGPGYLLCGILKALAPTPMRRHYMGLLRNRYAGTPLDLGEGP